MLTLYGKGRSRWVKPYWTLQELGLPFETQIIPPNKIHQEHKSFLQLNPYAKVPALKDDDFVLYESSAICTYLADKYFEKGLIPKSGTQARGRYEQWISFIISELEQPLWRITKEKYLYQDSRKLPADIDRAKDDFARITEVLEEEITDYLIDDKFSVADIAMTYTLKWADGFEMLMPESKFKNYMELHMSRPAFPAVLYK